MKKKLALVVTIILLSCNISFGQNYNVIDDGNNNNVDAFFLTQSNNKGFRSDDNGGWGVMPSMIGHGYEESLSGAPTGSGLLILSCSGIAYGIRRKENNK